MSDTPPPPILDKRLLLINSVGGVLIKLLNVAVMIWTAQYLLNRISPEEYELLPIVMSIMMFVPLASFVLTSGVGRFVVEADARGDHPRVRQIVSTMYVVCLAASAVLGVAFAGFVIYIDWVLDIPPERVGEARLMLGLLLGVFCLRLPAAPFCTGLYARQRFVRMGLIDIASTFTRSLVMLVLLLGVSPRVLWVVIAMVASQLLGLLLTVTLSRRAMPQLRFRLSAIHLPLVRPLTGFGFWHATGQLAHSLRQSADPIILNKLSVPIEVNAYYIGGLIDRNLQALLGQATRPLEPILIGIHAADTTERLANVTLRVTRVNMWVALLPISILLIFHEPIMRLYLGEAFNQYPQAAIVLMLLILPKPLGLTVGFVSKLAIAKNRMGPFTRQALALQLTNLAVTCVLVGYFSMGSIGSALATCIVGSLWTFVVWLPMLRRLSGLGIRQVIREAMMPGMTPMMLSSAIVWGGHELLDLGEGFWAIAWQSAVLAVLYLAITRTMFNPADLADWQKIAQRVRRKFRLSRG